MQTHKSILICLFLPFMLLANNVLAESDQQRTIQNLSDSWAEASVGADSSAQKKQFQSTLTLLDTALTHYKEDPEVLAWAGIIEASYAGTLKGMAALKHAKIARKYLSRALEKNAEALDGGARSTLGVLYYKVPPWPIGFGNKKKAAALLQESAQKYPTSLNAQYFYAEYLVEQNRKAEATRIFKNALAIPVRPTHQQIDTARISKIESYLVNLI